MDEIRESIDSSVKWPVLCHWLRQSTCNQVQISTPISKSIHFNYFYCPKICRICNYQNYKWIDSELHELTSSDCIFAKCLAFKATSLIADLIDTVEKFVDTTLHWCRWFDGHFHLTPRQYSPINSDRITALRTRLIRSNGTNFWRGRGHFRKWS